MDKKWENILKVTQNTRACQGGRGTESERAGTVQMKMEKMVGVLYTGKEMNKCLQGKEDHAEKAKHFA